MEEERKKLSTINTSRQEGNFVKGDCELIGKTTPLKREKMIDSTKPRLNIKNIPGKGRDRLKFNKKGRTTIDPFGIEHLVIEPPEVQCGEPVSIHFDAVNESDFYSMYAVNLKINGKVVAAEVIKLPPNAQLPMFFTAREKKPGEYNVKVNHVSGKFIVLPTEAGNEPLELLASELSNSTAEAVFEPGLTEVESYLQEKPGDTRKRAESTPGRSLYALDGVGSYLEVGLDKLGDGIIFGMEKLISPFVAIAKGITGRKKRGSQ
jgi:hypothetical protein